jgi:hypothetical protein
LYCHLGQLERAYAPAAVEPPGSAADPEEMAAFLGSVLEATRADIATAYRAKQDGRRREADVHRSAVRLTERAAAESPNSSAPTPNPRPAARPRPTASPVV